MDLIRFDCPHCGAAIDVPEHAAGQSGTCDTCGERLTIPAPSRRGSATVVALASTPAPPITAPPEAPALPILLSIPAAPQPPAAPVIDDTEPDDDPDIDLGVTPPAAPATHLQTHTSRGHHHPRQIRATIAFAGMILALLLGLAIGFLLAYLRLTSRR